MSIRQAWSDARQAWRSMRDGIARHVPTITLNVISSSLFAIAGAFIPSPRAWTYPMLLVAAVLMAVGLWASRRLEARSHNLEALVDSQKAMIRERDETIRSLRHLMETGQTEEFGLLRDSIHRMFDEFANRILSNMNADGNSHVRVTLYGYLVTGDRSYFVPLARASHNPRLERIRRTSYPDDEVLSRTSDKPGQCSNGALGRKRGVGVPSLSRNSVCLRRQSMH